MTTYLAGLFCVSALIGISTYLSYGEDGDKFLRAVSSLILAYVVISPLLTIISETAKGGIYDFEYEDFESSLDDTEFQKSVERAFRDGVKSCVVERFSLSENEVAVTLIGFDAEKMRAQKIKILLFGRAAFADNRAISAYVTENGLGECEVEISVK